MEALGVDEIPGLIPTEEVIEPLPAGVSRVPVAGASSGAPC
jgi:hypothetical protein